MSDRKCARYYLFYNNYFGKRQFIFVFSLLYRNYLATLFQLKNTLWMYSAEKQ